MERDATPGSFRYLYCLAHGIRRWWSLSDAQRYRELVETFARGWQEGDLDVLVSVFTADGIYLETPFSEPDRGVSAIRKAWEGVRLNHADVSFRCGEIYVAGPWFAAEFRCTFRRRRTGEPVDARGAMFCETSDGKISEMRMYWHRFAGNRDTSKP